jgi:hypothetical protein
LEKVSILNAFLVYILREHIEFKCGESQFDEGRGTFIIDGHPEDHVSHVKLLRHGTNKDAIIDEIAGLRDRVDINNIKQKQKEEDYILGVKPLWGTNDEYDLIFKKSFNEHIKEVTGNALQFFETFANHLSQQIVNARKKRFRFTIHKICKENSSVFYRQIIPYFGSEKSNRHGGYGRLFKWNNGSVGYSLFNGEPLFILRNQKTESHYQEILKNLNLAERLKSYQDSNKKSILSLPIMARNEDEDLNKQTYANFILYIDSEDDDFFEDGSIFAILQQALRMFVSTFESLIDQEQITFIDKPNPFKDLKDDSNIVFGDIGKGELFGDAYKPYQTFLNNIRQVTDSVTLKQFYCLT